MDVTEAERARLAALADLGVLDTSPEQAFDDIAALAAEICITPIALVTLVDERRQWFKAHHGWERTQTPRSQSFAALAIQDPSTVFSVSDASSDPRFVTNPLVVGEPCIRFYAGAPIVTSDGHAIGSVDVLDGRARELTERQRRALQQLARQAGALFELGRLRRELAATSAHRDEAGAALEQAWGLLDHQARHDPLTSLPNRRQLLERMDQALVRLRRRGGMVAVLFLDLDDFKTVNDRHGNSTADRVLVEIAARTRGLVRGDDVVGRVGGDEFVVLCEDMKGVSEAVALAGRLLRRVEQPIALDEGSGFGGALASFTVSGSVGIACTLAALDTADELLRRASDAMYAAKRAGRNRVEVAEP